MKRLSFALLLSGFIVSGCTSSNTSTLENILSNGSEAFQSVLKNPTHEVQIIYGEIIGDSIIHHSFQVDEDVYFYPASTVKMPVAFAAIKMAQEEGISLDDYLIIDSTAIYPRNIFYDSTFQDSITIRNLAKMIFTVSDNAANNILYGWLGKDYLNNLYEGLGSPTRIIHQLGESAFSFKPISNHYSRQAQFIKSDGSSSTFEETAQSFTSSMNPTHQQKGVGFTDSLGNLVNEPFDFSKKNFVPLASLIEILEMGVRPDLLPSSKQLQLQDSYQAALLETMNMLPSDLPPPYDSLTDNYVKFLIAGNEEDGSIPSSVSIKNKVGWAYGYLSDIAFVEDKENNIQFFLAAVIHVNENQIYNDGVYEYEAIGLPFLDELGDLVYGFELAKKNQ